MRLAFCLLIVSVLSGCGAKDDGPGYAPVSGTVTLDGSPVEGAVVTFVPESGSGNTGQISMGITDSAGQFSLATGTGKVGAAIGNHSIAVELTVKPTPPAPTDDGLAPALPNELASAPAKEAEQKTLFVVPERYNSPQSSGLKATVEASGLSDHKIELTK